MEKKEIKMNLPKITVDDLFSTQEERDSLKLEKVVNIPISDITDFPKHPFKVLVNDDLYNMVDSIKENGVLSPVLVRQKEDGKYEMIAGHRRKKASELANLIELPCIVRDLTDDEATIIMVDSNMQREKLLPSEKAFAYKLKLEAMKHQGKRFEETSCQVGTKYRTDELLAQEVNESARNIQRYIRLTYLMPEILEMVDNERIAFNPAVALSYLTEEEQYTLLDTIQYSDCTPSLAQAIHLKKLSQEGTLTAEKIEDLMEQDKPNQNPKLKVSMNRLNPVLPPTLKNDREKEEYIIKAVEFYDRYQKKMREKRDQER
ncbi:MAG: ParB/RepB/Spo0J family partition protein [Bacteroidales bacterium]|nr:ParB/RepB/Spo0J family partition protein [Bacteroidales bacterium]